MTPEFDVAILGGAFSGAATALLIKRQRPEARVLIIEKATEFDRKVGESTTEVSSCFLTKILGLTSYLGHEQLVKQGLRLWFANRPDQPFDECVEIGARYQARLPTFQVDRSKLDAHLLDLARQAGCEVWQPAKVTRCDLNGTQGQSLGVRVGEEEREVRCRWVVDATGRASFLARKLGHFCQNTEHPINAVWARFSGLKDWDSYEWREKFPDYAAASRTGRAWATNHLMGQGWWCWIIPLKGGDFSAGLVYDSRLFTLPPGANLGERLHDHILAHPVGREIFRAAKVAEHDTRAYSALPYYSAQVCGDGWAIAGDAASFIDPLYSPGLDLCAYTTSVVSDLVARALGGEEMSARQRYYNEQFATTYRSWFETLYKDKYYYLGEADLMSAALLLDVGTYFIGLVRPVYTNPERAFLELPFEGTPGRMFAGMMKFYNQRLSALAKNRIAHGTCDRHNAGWRELYDGFVPDVRLHKLIRKGLFRWWKAELLNLRFLFASPKPAARAAAPQAAAVEV
ncbi:MAG: NAD(P)/FAD-dependent oxidoreductase [Verrucomicrobiota bacterium]|nr:NAD(P)/FAD-dependent oxidoreductase [Verrucomicrobiota bacterium]